MKFTVQQIADMIGGEVKGNPSLEISNIAKIDEDADEHCLCFVDNPNYEKYVYTTNAGVVLVKSGFIPRKDYKTNLIEVENPRVAFAQILQIVEKNLKPNFQNKGISKVSHICDSTKLPEDIFIAPFVYIGENVQIGKNVQIHANCYISDNVQIGNNCIIHAGVKVYHQSQIGNDCIIHAGAVIGADGFGFAPQEGGKYITVPQLGNVIIYDDVSIGANTTIDRATIGATIIGEGVKLDNLVQIGHNVEIGKNTVISAQVGIAGSCKIGENCLIAGQAGISHSVTIPNDTKIGGQAGVGGQLKEEGMTLLGAPAFDLKKYYRSYAIFRNLPDLKKRLDQIEKETKDLKQVMELGKQIQELEEKILNLSSTESKI